MLPVNFGFDPATSLNVPLSVPKSGGATPAATGPGSFHTMLHDAAAARDEAPAKTAPAHRENAMNGTSRRSAVEDSHTRAMRRQDVTAAAETNTAAAKSAPTRGEDTMNETDRGAAVEDSDVRPTCCQDPATAAEKNTAAAEASAKTAPAQGEVAANGTECQPVWALLAQIIQNLIAAADTNGAAVDGQNNAVVSAPAEGESVATDPAEGDAAEILAALVDLLKQLQESPEGVTAETAIPLDRLRQTLEQWQSSANESRPAGLPGQLVHLLKNIQEDQPGIAWGRWAAALAHPDGASEKVPLEKAIPAGAGPSPSAVSQSDGLPVGAGRTARGVLLDAKGTQVAADKSEAAVPVDEPSSGRGRPAADERSLGAGRVMAAAPAAASPPVETLRSTAVSSKAQASEGSIALPRNFESTPDTQSEVSDDSQSPTDKATAGLALPTVDQLAEESGSPSLRFEAALRDVRSFAVAEGNPDKPAEAAAAAKGRDTAAAPVKTDVFDQIVQRAAVHVKSGQGEVRIDLKPEFMGNVRLQIVTDNQHVTVRILTELPMVRDMIESSIQQLKSDLQQQGLRVDRVEVAVADDPRQHQGRQARNGAGHKNPADGAVAPAATEISAGLRPEAAYRWGLGGQTTINMFA
jgi:flagellar hook-length control protein FliK